MNIVAILSTTVLPIDGYYKVETLYASARNYALSSLEDVPHYIGHPDTKAIIEALEAVQAPTRLFAGLKVGESALCFPIKQGLSDRASKGLTSPNQAIAEIDSLDVRLLTRID